MFVIDTYVGNEGGKPSGNDWNIKMIKKEYERLGIFLKTLGQL